MPNRPKPVVLVILDGWGIAPPVDSNAVTSARTPNFNSYVANYPAMTLLASGESVGLSWGEMGNSEVGHLNLGVGKIFYQNLPRIGKSIDDESFFSNSVLQKAVEHVKKNNGKLHLMGLVSDGKVHSAMKHCLALLDFAKRMEIKDVLVHAFLDGRDTPFNSAQNFLAELQEKIDKLKIGRIASLHGRLYAMDRDNHWERIEKSYSAMVLGKAEETFADYTKALELSYKDKVFDEEFVPCLIGKNIEQNLVKDNDAVVFFNYRADRGRELTKTFVLDNFEQFKRGEKLQNLFFATMTEYEEGLPVEIIFPREEIKASLPKQIALAGLRQLHVAETEKYAHVTFFFSGGEENPFEGEDRLVIPSPRVDSYSRTPAMSAGKLKETLVKEIVDDKYDFIVVNFANPDMVGHTGDLGATVAAVEFTDKCLGELIHVILEKDGVALITADHGNAEELLNLQTGEMDKEHSTNPVPFIVVGRKYEGRTTEEVELVGHDLSLIQPIGLLSDIAPTILKIMGLEIPKEMSGKPLID
ncbi:MAG: 2,3-bisphosphoglycerate-independent phosphoglycerate mutase [Patescibacteria group bacterium]